MDNNLKEAFKSEFYISTPTVQPECKLWHSIGMHICPDKISIFNVNVNRMRDIGFHINTVNDIKNILKANGFKKVKQGGCWKERETWVIPSNIANYDKAIEIIEKYDTKMYPDTLKTSYY